MMDDEKFKENSLNPATIVTTIFIARAMIYNRKIAARMELLPRTFLLSAMSNAIFGLIVSPRKEISEFSSSSMAQRE
jgi:hypothetical protein